MADIRVDFKLGLFLTFTLVLIVSELQKDNYEIKKALAKTQKENSDIKKSLSEVRQEMKTITRIQREIKTALTEIKKDNVEINTTLTKVAILYFEIKFDLIEHIISRLDDLKHNVREHNIMKRETSLVSTAVRYFGFTLPPLVEQWASTLENTALYVFSTFF